MTIEEWLGNNELSLKIWHNKYQYKDETFDEWLNRISDGNESIRQLILEKKFLFGGRILANRGITDRKITYSNCYVITPPEDNIESIFECASKLARTFSYGGGCGIDLSKLRPKGARTSNAAKESTGPVSFMDIYSQVTGTISQAGRRGALMISLDVNHPDIDEFIDCKTDLSRVNYANISVRVNDEFMEAVEKDKDYFLSWPCDNKGDFNIDLTCEYNKLYSTVSINNEPRYYKKVKAKELFTKLAKNNWDYAEPGILYWDNIQNYNLLDNTDFVYAGVNPCAEEPLPAGGSCLLGSLNLAEFVKNGIFDYQSLEDATIKAVSALNEVLMDGLNLHPLDEQQQSVGDWRQIGLGTFGLADALIKLKIVYGSKESRSIIEEIYKTIATSAVQASLQLARIQGCYKNCQKELLVKSSFIKNLNLPSQVLDDIKKYGLYNSQLLTCAPTGTISTMLQVSGGVEPIFAMKYTRTTKSLEGKDKAFDVYTKIAEDWFKENPDRDTLPYWFVESKDIIPSDRIEVQSLLQKYIDASISSTINLPEKTTVKEVYDIYMNAWKRGLKGVTIFRANCKRIAILAVEPKKEEETKFFDTVIPVSRKSMGVTQGCTFCKKCACGTLYITVNKDEKGNLVEVFTHTSKGGICQANLNAETRMVSLALRSGVKIDEVVDQLKGISCPACTAVKAKGKQLDGISCADIIARTIEEFQSNKHNKPKSRDVKEIPEFTECPECHEKTLLHGEGCVQCTSCGYSKCG